MEALVGGDDFLPLLTRAIRISVRPGLARFVRRNLDLAPPEVPVGYAIPDAVSAARARWLWVARLKVFENLMGDKDFLQFLLEFAQTKSGWERWLKWGEEMIRRLPKASGAAAPEAHETASVGSILAGFSAPLLMSLAFVAPIVGGAWFVSNHVIEKQSEIRTREAYIHTDRDYRYSSDRNYSYIEKVSDLSEALRAVQARMDAVEKDVADNRRQVDTLYKKLVELLGKQREQKDDYKVHLTFDSWPEFKLAPVSPLIADLNLHPPNDEFTVRLGNAPFNGSMPKPEPPQATLHPNCANTDPNCPKISASAMTTKLADRAPDASDQPAFRVDHHVEDMKVTTEALPLLDAIRSGHNTVPPSTLLEFKEGQFSQRIPGFTGSKNTKYPVLQLCTQSSPFRFLVRYQESSEAVSQPDGCVDSKTTQDDHYVTITNTPSYDDKLGVYFTLDLTSHRKFFIGGPRHVVVEVSPKQAAPATAPPGPPSKP